MFQLTTRRGIGGLVLVLAALLCVGCSGKHTPNPAAALIESYRGGVITIEHQGVRYTAKCQTSRSFNNVGFVSDPGDVRVLPACDLAIGLVGREIQPYAGRERDEGGRIVTMWFVGDVVSLRSWKDERSPWRQDDSGF